jgi:hypothetical protein
MQQNVEKSSFLKSSDARGPAFMHFKKQNAAEIQRTLGENA